MRTRGFEGKFEGTDFVAHDGDRREISKSDVYKLGEAWNCDDRVWAYWTQDNKYLNSGKVTAVGAENLNVHTVSFWDPVVGRLILVRSEFHGNMWRYHDSTFRRT